MDEARREYDEAVRTENPDQIRWTYIRIMEIAAKLDGEISCQNDECGEPAS